ncbi:MAG: NADH-quinone oxidoreductase subunit A [Dehalococcoidia bacterium]|nr:NADH-quinone oxidoreductase subunit A [Dehalococcoidia bacterium]
MAQDLWQQYAAVIVATVLGFLMVGLALLANHILAPRQATRPKGLTYECGMLPIGRGRFQIHFRYYLFAILFLVFDIEAVFLFPWALSFLDVGEMALYEMVLFILVLGFGLYYAWRKGVLQWR